MNREQAESLLAQLVFDDLEEPARSELLEYLKTDPELNERLGDMRLAAKLLRDAVEAEQAPTLDDQHRDELKKRIDRDQRKRGVLRVIGMTRMHPAVAALVVISTVAILVAILFPALGAARHTALQVVATSRTRQIGVGVQAYAHDNKGRLPERVSQLVEGGYVSTEDLIAPGSEVVLPKNMDQFTPSAQSQWIDRNSSFKLLARGKRVEEVEPDRIVGYMVHDGEKGVSIARGDGSTVFETETESQVIQEEMTKPWAIAESTTNVGSGAFVSSVRSVPRADDLAYNQARIDAARRKLAVKDEQKSPQAAESAGVPEGAAEPNLNERYAGRGYALHSQVPAGESRELHEFYDRSASRGTLSAGQPESEVLGQQVASSEELGLSSTSGSKRLGRTPAESVELYDSSTVGRPEEGGAYGAMGGYGGAAGYGAFGLDSRKGAIALNEPADQSGRWDSLGFDYGRPPMAVGDEVARGGAVVLGDDAAEKSASVQSQSTPTPAATPMPQLPALTHAPVKKLNEALSSAESEQDQTLLDVRLYAQTKDLSQLTEEQRARIGELATTDTSGSDQLHRYPAEWPKDWPQVTSGRIKSESEGKIILGVELRDLPAEEAPAAVDALAADATGEQSDIKEGVAIVPATPAKTELASQLAPTPQQDPQPARKPRLMPVNPWVMTADDQLSTFALDVDTASYDIARRYIHDGFLPPRHTVRMEEFVNSFDYNYPTGQGDSEAFTVHAEAGENPFGEGTVLLKVAVRGKVVGRDRAKPAHLVFVVDTSGSMDRDDRLPLVRQSLAMVLDQLAPQDRVTVVSYGTEARLLIESAPAEDRMRILDALESLQTGGSTNLLSGIALGYEVAQRHFVTGGVNRVILCSDGVANVGTSEADDLLNQAQTLRRQGVTFTSVGFGAGNYDDRVLEQLANKGDGGYLFVGSLDEARRVFVDNLAATRPTIAYDAKIQVDFDPARVRRYRLIGYENRDIADEDFRNDTVDAGEVGSGQSSTALYELELLGPVFAAGDQPDLGTVYVRYRDADTGQVREIESRITNDLVAHRTAESNPRFYLAACAARFAEVLRGSEHVTDPDINRNLVQVRSVLESVVTQLPMDGSARELLELVHRAQGLPRAE